MTLLILVAILAAAALGGILGALAPQLYRLLHNRLSTANAAAPTNNHHDHQHLPGGGPDRLDPDLRRHIHDLSTIWAASRGHPEAAHLAGRYLADAAQDAQTRWERLR